ncbi:MAG: ABC transporter ATP-binding protein [Gammaproteobacteria bacterium]|jgi:microcin C transport system ATP-binding protein
MTATPTLRVRDLRVDFETGGEPIRAVDSVSFDMSMGETLALVGESGSGKSVTALSILQLLPTPPARYCGGQIYFHDVDIFKMSNSELRAIRGDRIAVVFQEPMSSLNPLHTVEKQITEILQVHKNLDATVCRERTLELLDHVGIPNAEQRLGAYPHELSGGQRQRVMIAMALANEPEIMIADEPTTALDVTVQAQILELLKKLQRETNMALLLITHDLSVVRNVADRVCVMTKGKIVESGDTSAIFSSPNHEYTKRLLAAEPKSEPPIPSTGGQEIVGADNLKIWFPIKKGVFRRTVDYVKAVDGVTVSVRAGHTVGVVGESGSGKSTLAMGLVRMETSEGVIRVEGKQIQDMKWDQLRPLRREMQVVFQDPFSSLSPRMSVGQIIEEGLIIHSLVADPKERRRMVGDMLEEVGLDPDCQDRYPHEFSGGQRQRIAIARAMILNPRFVILDEPTSALDVSVQAQIVDLLRELQEHHNLAYLFISHDLKVVRAMADDLIVMQRGKVVEQGPSADIFANPKHPYTRALLAAAFDLEAIEGEAISC